MKVSSKAWHLRLVRMLNPNYVPKDLCTHFLVVIGTLISSQIFTILLPLLLLIAAALWVRSKKERFCPLIEVVESSDLTGSKPKIP